MPGLPGPSSPQDALETYLDVLEEACEAQNRRGREAVMDILRSADLGRKPPTSALEQELLNCPGFRLPHPRPERRPAGHR